MAMKTESTKGQCPTHGRVTATREIPSPQFPFVVYAARRYLARRKAFVCPTCSHPVDRT
ncbi:MAG TPA: hypothetical protein VGN54_01405 [Mycobacteriales bacterium]|jgi:endogenous inhibitor of DNA gyrase (YacG/DUF329 family)|nr:hypothetical protein [Mycobacteriales bacterium]